MKRRRYAGSEQDLLDKLKHENRRLKQTISQLRKQMARLDIDRFQNLKEVLDAQDRRQAERKERAKAEQLKQDWTCWDCEIGVLKLVIFERHDGIQYLRKCDNCTKRTKLKPYSDKIKGVRD